MKRLFFLFFVCFGTFSILFSCKEDETKTDRYAQIQANKESGELFLKNKRQEEGVKEDPSGLLYSILTPSDGPKPGAMDTVFIHYEGFRIDGKKFITNTESVAMENLMEGLHIGLRHMNEGATNRLYVPYYLAYGASSMTFKIDKDTINVKEYSALYYDVRLDSIIFVK